MASKDTADFFKIPNLLEKLKQFGGSFVPGWVVRDIVKSLGDNELHRDVWKDLTVQLSQASAKNAANDPTWAVLVGGIYAWSFPAGADKELFLAFHINHDIKPGSLMYPHVHWSPGNNNTGVCRWVLEYTVAKGHGQEVFGATNTIVLEQAGSGTPLMHQIIETDENNAIVAPEVDSLIIMRLAREGSHANDTLTDGAFGLTVDFHYQANATGTVNKAPDFYQEDYEV